MRGTRFHLDHSFVRRRLSAYLDGELVPPERERVERHLVECENCGRTRRALVRMLAGLRTLRASPRRDVARGAVERLRAEEVPRAGRQGPLT
jgi:anti-sigma factor RsiW